MNIETSNLKQTKDVQKVQTSPAKEAETTVKFSDELKELKETKPENSQYNDKANEVSIAENTDNTKKQETSNEKVVQGVSPENNLNIQTDKSKIFQKETLQINIENKLYKQTPESNNKKEIQEDLQTNNKFNFHSQAMELNVENTPIESLQTNPTNKFDEQKTQMSTDKFTGETLLSDIKKQKNNNINNPKNIEIEKDNELGKAIAGLSSIVNQLNQSDDKTSVSIKKDKDLTDKNNMINNDMNIQENKDLLPQMNPNMNMNFGGDGQPFSSFMNNEQQNTSSSNKISSSAKDLAEEAAILSTMAENIAIANKNTLIKTPEENIIKNPKVKTITNNQGIKKVDTKTDITVENIVKYDAVIMNEADVEVFAQLIQNGEANINNLAPQAAQKSVQVSKTLADMIAKSMENNQPMRIDFDNDISVIIRISRDGKISADFLPSSQVAEAYLKENLPLLRQKFDDNNIKYDELNQRERREQSKDNNRKKGRNDE